MCVGHALGALVKILLGNGEKIFVFKKIKNKKSKIYYSETRETMSIFVVVSNLIRIKTGHCFWVKMGRQLDTGRVPFLFCQLFAEASFFSLKISFKCYFDEW